MQNEVIKNSRVAGEQLTAFLEASPERRAMFARGCEFTEIKTVDLDLNPRRPLNGSVVEEHKKGGTVSVERRVDGVYIGGRKYESYYSKRQLKGKTIDVHELRKELDGKPVLNACFLDFLIANQAFVPEDMKKEGVITYFWGTIYYISHGHQHVRRCFWLDGRLVESYSYLADTKCGDANPVACLAN